LSFGTEHLSLYQLTVEPETPFATMHKRGLFQLPGEDLAAAFYETTQEIAAQAGLPAYEVSNHARPGCESRHNLLYWRYGAYAGVGPGAHGRLEVAGKRIATVCERLPERWREKVARNGHGLTDISEIDTRSGAREHLLMNLRLSEGLDLAAYRARWGCAPSSERIAALATDGLVKLESGRLAATPRGMLVLNRVIEELAV
jgi:oxygen-independent coproporphyrinogen-3 oxidase